MPLTFIDIERQKSWRIGIVFLFLIVLYFAIIGTPVYLILSLGREPINRYAWLIPGAISLVIACIHFFFSSYNAVTTIIHDLNGQPPDPQDDIHKTLLNIMQEIQVVTGNRKQIQCAILPTLSLNALAAADLKGNAVICVTEGLISRLSRPQLETVISHEAHHILSGDCLETTAAVSLLTPLSSFVEGSNSIDYFGERVFVFNLFSIFGWCALKLTTLLNMLISREREYRADAAAVRMTRNPVALAETLYLLSRSWRGATYIGRGYEMLCMVNLEATALDESEGFWADLFSTHPPIQKRINTLLAMAHMNIASLNANKKATPASEPTGTGYFALNPQQQWQGPFTLSELGALPWLSPLTWTTTGDKHAVERAWKDSLINPLFAARLTKEERIAQDFTCPVCQNPLLIETYEGTQVYQCRFCAGILVDNNKIPRILARTGRDRPCSERVRSLSKTVLKENQLKIAQKKLGTLKRNPESLLSCPKCNNSMYRGFYSVHLIEIDRCSFCGLTWFDQDELEMLQCLIENRIVPGERIREQWP